MNQFKKSKQLQTIKKLFMRFLHISKRITILFSPFSCHIFSDINFFFNYFFNKISSFKFFFVQLFLFCISKSSNLFDNQNFNQTTSYTNNPSITDKNDLISAKIFSQIFLEIHQMNLKNRFSSQNNFQIIQIFAI